MKYLPVAAVFILLAFMLLGIKGDSLPAGGTGSLEPNYSQPASAYSPLVSIDGLVIPVELRRTSEEIKQGLSGRKSLDADKGMLFIFSRPAFYTFWMPDMHFSIDIIWIDGSGKIVDITKSVPYDEARARILYRPKEPAQYVLEVNAGFSDKKGIEIGDKIFFYNID